ASEAFSFPRSRFDLCKTRRFSSNTSGACRLPRCSFASGTFLFDAQRKGLGVRRLEPSIQFVLAWRHILEAGTPLTVLQRDLSRRESAKPHFRPGGSLHRRTADNQVGQYPAFHRNTDWQMLAHTIAGQFRDDQIEVHSIALLFPRPSYPFGHRGYAAVGLPAGRHLDRHAGRDVAMPHAAAARRAQSIVSARRKVDEVVGLP